jgi:uncharacterized phiE125 gp8 family phage protein
MILLEPKRADEKRTHRHNWLPFLGEDTIATQTTVGDGVTVDSSTIEAGTAIRFKLSGGTNGTTATVTQSIVTTNGEEETEIFTIRIAADGLVSLDQAKEYLRVRHDDEDAKIAAMIPRAQAWVEDHTGLALTQREFTEYRTVERGVIRLDRGPLVSVGTAGEIAYVGENGEDQTYSPLFFVPSTKIYPAAEAGWPTLNDGHVFTITYVAGFAPGEVDERLIGAIMALVEGEYAEGYAWPERSIQAAERCCNYLRAMVV